MRCKHKIGLQPTDLLICKNLNQNFKRSLTQAHLKVYQYKLKRQCQLINRLSQIVKHRDNRTMEEPYSLIIYYECQDFLSNVRVVYTELLRTLRKILL